MSSSLTERPSYRPIGEVLRFRSVLPARLTELATLVVARAWTQQFEWCVHVPLALQAGDDTSPDLLRGRGER